MRKKWYCVNWCRKDEINKTIIKARFKFLAYYKFKKSIRTLVSNYEKISIVSVVKRN
jgi:hypothetical protein